MKNILIILALLLPFTILGQTINIKTSKSTDSLSLSQVDSIRITRNIIIFSITPSTAKIGDIINISGFGFGQSQSGNNVYLNDNPFTDIKSWNDSLIVIKVPADAASGNIYVKINNIKSNELLFILNIPDPIIYEIKPNKVFAGDTIKIRGLNFGQFPANSFVMFNNNIRDSVFLSWKDSLITTVVPKYSRTGKVYANIQGKKSNDSNLFVKPFISSLSKNNFIIGEQIAINGYNFGDKKDTNKLVFNGINIINITAWSDTSIYLNVPPKVQTGKISMNVNGLLSNQFDYKIIPNIISMSPDSVGATDYVTFRGTGFGNNKTNGSVNFRDSVATDITVWNDSLIVSALPFIDSSGVVSITVAGLKSNEKSFIIIPKIFSISPDTAFIDDAVDIKGWLLGNTLGQVNFGTIGVFTFDSWQDNEIKGVKIPKTASTCNVVVKTNSNGSSHGFKIYIAPKITLLNPDSAYVNDLITIAGNKFGAAQGYSTVNFRGAAASSITLWSDLQIAVKVPSGARTGKFSLLVDGLKSNEMDFKVLPKITRISSLTAPVNYIDSVYGQSFGADQGTNTLNINGQAITTINSWSNGLIIFTIPSNCPSGPLNVVIDGIFSNSFNFSFNPNNCIDADGNIYNSIQIGTQVWMSENLRVGTRLPKTTAQTDNGIAEKYLVNDYDGNNIPYGGLYQWNELMQYTTTEGARGLCPQGWHIPTYNEWNILVNYVGPNDQMTKLSPGGSSGFNAQFGGYFWNATQTYYGFPGNGWYWTSTLNTYQSLPYYYLLQQGSYVSSGFTLPKESGLSCRCIKD